MIVFRFLADDTKSTQRIFWQNRVMNLQSPLRRGLIGMLCALVVLATGCAGTLEKDHARVRVETLQIPVLYKAQGIIISIDGHKFGPNYSSVRVPAGYHEIHAVFVACPLPALVVTCFEGALEQIVPLDAVAGETYIIRRGEYSLWAEPESRIEERRSGS